MDINFSTPVSDHTLADFFLNESLDDQLVYPLNLRAIDKAQQQDKPLLK